MPVCGGLHRRRGSATVTSISSRYKWGATGLGVHTSARWSAPAKVKAKDQRPKRYLKLAVPHTYTADAGRVVDKTPALRPLAKTVPGSMLTSTSSAATTARPSLADRDRPYAAAALLKADDVAVVRRAETSPAAAPRRG